MCGHIFSGWFVVRGTTIAQVVSGRESEAVRESSKETDNAEEGRELRGC
jgi:hypothetical protein